MVIFLGLLTVSNARLASQMMLCAPFTRPVKLDELSSARSASFATASTSDENLAWSSDWAETSAALSLPAGLVSFLQAVNNVTAKKKVVDERKAIFFIIVRIC
jgi:hypothetical protein